MIVGNAPIVSFFNQVEAAENWHQAYGFIGPDQIGKRTLVRGLAARLLDCPDQKLAIHPDFCYLTRLPDEKTGKLPKELGVEEARKLRERLQGRPWNGGYRIVIIDEAELLTTEAGNALLKILEEPPEKTIIFLLAEDEERLLATIRSRVQLFHFALASDDEVKASLLAAGIAETQSTICAAIAAGRPGLAFELAKDEDRYTAWTTEAERWKKVLGKPFHEKLTLIEPWFAEKDESQRPAERVSTALDIWIRLWRETLLVKTAGHSLLSAFLPGEAVLATMDEEEIVMNIDRAAEVKQLLRQNIQPRLSLEQALIYF